MKDYKIPLAEYGKGGFCIKIDPDIYSLDTITSTIYKYTNEFYIHQQTDSSSGLIVVIFETKNPQISISDTIVKQFCNDLVDQQIRFVTNQKFGHIRDMIVEEAFKPVSV